MKLPGTTTLNHSKFQLMFGQQPIPGDSTTLQQPAPTNTQQQTMSITTVQQPIPANTQHQPMSITTLQQPSSSSTQQPLPADITSLSVKSPVHVPTTAPQPLAVVEQPTPVSNVSVAPQQAKSSAIQPSTCTATQQLLSSGSAGENYGYSPWNTSQLNNVVFAAQELLQRNGSMFWNPSLYE